MTNGKKSKIILKKEDDERSKNHILIQDVRYVDLVMTGRTCMFYICDEDPHLIINCCDRSAHSSTLSVVNVLHISTKAFYANCWV